jgi:predicted nicotinamide N-methyase
MASLEHIGKACEKNILRGMFQQDEDDSSFSCFSSDDDEVDQEEQRDQEILQIMSVDRSSSSDIELSNHINSTQRTEGSVGRDGPMVAEEHGLELSYHSPVTSTTIILYQDKRKGIAHQLWPAATFLCDYIDQNTSSLLATCGYRASEDQHPLTIIELGAGIGLCGIFLAKLLSNRVKQVYLTDLPEAMSLLSQNISANIPLEPQSHISSHVLRWGETEDYLSPSADGSSPPLIIAADCVYWEHLHEPLLHVLSHYTMQGSHVLLSNVRRWKKDHRFFKLCKKHGMNVDILHEVVGREENEHTQEQTRSVMRIYHIYRS